MAAQNFAATASYFDRRAYKALTSGRQNQLEAAAAHYRAKAGSSGNQCDKDHPITAGQDDIPPRRRRLMELFRAYSGNPE